MVVYGISGKETDLILGNRQSIIGVRREAKDILDAYQEMQRLKGLLDFNLNKSITWNYVSTIMKGVMEV